MPWTTPATWVTNYVMTASDLNTYLRDNPNYLLTQRPTAEILKSGSANYSTTSTTYVDVDSTNIKVSITPVSTRALVWAQFQWTTSSQPAWFDIYCDVLNARGGAATFGLGGGFGGFGGLTLVHIFTGLTPGVLTTFKLQWRVNSGGTGSIYNSTTGELVRMGAIEV
jgi:hypothetical protein